MLFVLSKLATLTLQLLMTTVTSSMVMELSDGVVEGVGEFVMQQQTQTTQ